MQKPSWRVRRRIIYATLTFCATTVGWLVVTMPDTRLAETLATGAMLLAGSVIGSYVFGAAWDDKNHMTASRGLPPVNDPPGEWDRN